MDFPVLPDDPESSPADDIDVDTILTPEEAEEALAERLQFFSAAVAKTRSKYIDGRRSSGIEREWLDAEDAYNGIDAANRAGATMMDAVASGYPITTNKAKPTRSTVFVGVTRQKTNTAEARIADILFPTDDRNWGIQPTPDPKITRLLKMELPPLQAAVTQAPQPGIPGAPGQPPNMPWVPGMPQPGTQSPSLDQQKALAQQVSDAAQEASDGMQREIDDALTDCDWNGTQRLVIHDAAVLGVGVVKGPIATSSVRKAWTPITDATGKTYHVLDISAEISPSSFHVSPWNFFPDPACGDDIHNGNGAMEVQFLSQKRVRELAKQPGYLRAQISKVLREGPQSAMTGADQRAMARMRNNDVGAQLGEDDLFEHWIHWGEFKPEDLLSAGVDVDTSDPLQVFSGCVEMINETVIKAYLHPMSGGDIPYDVVCWEKRSNSWAGYGVPHLVKWQQRVINAAWRMMMDNGGSVVGAQIVMKAGKIQPADKEWEVSGRKIWWVTDESENVGDAFTVFNIDSHQAEFQAMIELAMKFLDDESGVPQIASGEGRDVPDTVGGMQLLMASANTVVRRIVKQYDDSITKPHIRRYYDWMMEHSDKSEIKGDFMIDARGSSALVTRDIQNQAFLGMMQIARDPIYGIYIDPKRLFEKALQAQHIDPAEIMRTDNEISQIEAEQQGKGPTDPKVQAALISANSRVQIAQVRTQGQANLEQVRTQSLQAVEQSRSQTEMAYVETEAQVAKDNRAEALLELQLKERLAIITYANQRNMTMDQVKADLAKVAMQEQTKRDLANMELQIHSVEGDKGRVHDLNMQHLSQPVQPLPEPVGVQ